MSRTDEQLKRDIVEHFSWDGRIDASKVTVEIFIPSSRVEKIPNGPHLWCEPIMNGGVGKIFWSEIITRKEVGKAMEGHLLEMIELMGKYETAQCPVFGRLKGGEHDRGLHTRPYDCRRREAQTGSQDHR